MWTPIPFSILIEYHISTDYNLPIIRIVQLIAFGVIVLADEDETFVFIINFGSSLIQHVYMGYSSKDF